MHGALLVIGHFGGRYVPPPDQRKEEEEEDQQFLTYQKWYD
jgi:hypothetical protein